MRTKLNEIIRGTFFIGTLLLVACDGTISSNEEADERISYFKDARSKLCFAQISSTSSNGYKVVSITCVPCDSVKNLLIQK